jgi:putative endonuclease
VRSEQRAWHLYVVRCRGGELYAGIATDVARRLAEHEDGARGAKYLRGRGPLTLVLARRVGVRSDALRVEHAFKRLRKGDKESLVRDRRGVGRWVRVARRAADPAGERVVDS